MNNRTIRAAVAICIGLAPAAVGGIAYAETTTPTPTTTEVPSSTPTATPTTTLSSSTTPISEITSPVASPTSEPTTSSPTSSAPTSSSPSATSSAVTPTTEAPASITAGYGSGCKAGTVTATGPTGAQAWIRLNDGTEYKFPADGSTHSFDTHFPTNRGFSFRLIAADGTLLTPLRDQAAACVVVTQPTLTLVSEACESLTIKSAGLPANDSAKGETRLSNGQSWTGAGTEQTIQVAPGEYTAEAGFTWLPSGVWYSRVKAGPVTVAECPKPVVIPEPTATDECGNGGDSLTIPTPPEGWVYDVTYNGKTDSAVAPGTYKRADYGNPTEVVVVARQNSQGSSFGTRQQAPNTWSFIFTDEACATPPECVKVQSPTVTEVCGAGNDKIILPDGIEVVSADWIGNTYTLTFTTKDGYSYSEDKPDAPGVIHTWTYTDKETSCPIETPTETPTPEPSQPGPTPTVTTPISTPTPSTPVANTSSTPVKNTDAPSHEAPEGESPALDGERPVSGSVSQTASAPTSSSSTQTGALAPEAPIFNAGVDDDRGNGWMAVTAVGLVLLAVAYPALKKN